ncbi:MAG: glutamine--tRNA ligase/YqeY domain fusion protein [Eubacterium sp.]|jgi:glutaminyl-tRNA synthetase|nr:glutamine--tRNA ligase/YqeY domain fusion protein [Eubacterium sp.]MCH4047115.1 glutamine--tRNA ligase/YqeY domain fusion protein [Eubacterium sp.]MCH4080212.1 glutamine--tRNA ligase/YqeY domain fusion protein [Eubacterium sp.]MCH4111187.1 glutamine--tRNA ligase/YqeY domain fusion protein [Eubacterium sp.]MCI1306843.1 glutamine--tRNA ligase/YqeY domain fusion protein [Eubacterium sp.]
MAETSRPKNFIENIIDEDNEKGSYGGEVYTRFPPEPNGFLHIGHAKSVCLNFGLAKEYGGKCNLRFDDTNPTKENEVYVRQIKEDVKWLGFDWNKLCWASDYFDKMYEAAEELIRKGLAYVDDSTPEQIREDRGTLTEPGKESPYRNRSVEENMKLFHEMKDGAYGDGEKVLRAKIDMSSPNLNMRDPIIYRISHVTHHNTGDKWCIYPMYDFAHPIEDAIEGITHSICTLEFEDHRPLYNWVLEKVGFWPHPPKQIEFARLNLTNTMTSKRKLKKLVDEGLVDGWDDPRMPTIAGIRRRGFTPAAIRAFCEEIGVSKSNSTVDVGMLEHFVRNDLQNQVVSRNVVENPIKVIITNYPEGQKEMLPVENNRNNPDLGEREIPFSRELWIDGDDFMEVPVKKYFRLFPGNEVRFKGAYFVKCNEVIHNEDGSIKELHCTYDPETKGGNSNDGRKVKGTIHFVEASTAVKIRIRNLEQLMNVDENGEFTFNEASMGDSWGYAEPSIADAQPGERFQFFRHGYYIADSKLTTDREKVFNRIASLKSSWKPNKK